MDIIKVALFRHGRTIFMKVLEQDKRAFHDVSIREGFFFHTLVTSGCPQLSPSTVYVRGTDSGKDDLVVHYRFNAERDAKMAASDIMRLVAKENGFKDVEVESKPVFGNLYETAVNEAGDDENEVYVYTYTAQTEG
jgi:hypothetical protein